MYIPRLVFTVEANKVFTKLLQQETQYSLFASYTCARTVAAIHRMNTTSTFRRSFALCATNTRSDTITTLIDGRKGGGGRGVGGGGGGRHKQT